MVARLLIRNCETERFLIEILCPFQVIEIKFNPDESRSDWLHRMSSGFRIALAGILVVSVMAIFRQ
jgi:hypothetical protein